MRRGAPSGDAEAVDIVLSSGFLAFGRHLGFLRGVEAQGIPVPAWNVIGALVGALWTAGVLPAEMQVLFDVPDPFAN